MHEHQRIDTPWEGRLVLRQVKCLKFKMPKVPKVDNLVKSPKTVMPDLIRHPEVIEFTGFRLSPE